MSNPTIDGVSRARKVIGRCKDRKDENGAWLQRWSDVVDDCPVTAYSRAYGLWKGINTRCLVGGRFQSAGPTYIGVTNEFSGFQEFAEWCNEQPGYLGVDHRGMVYQLDKDILIHGNKAYSPDACCFVPRRINSMFTTSKAVRGDLPIGVSFQKSRGKFSAYCNHGAGMKYLGIFDDPLEAHRAWQLEKASVIKTATHAYRESPNADPKVVAALFGRAECILLDLENFLETKEV